MSLYPEIQPFDSGFLDVDGYHQIYYEQCGDPAGKPVVLLHGGPGAGCSPKMRRFHDPRAYRIVLFDQRGAGRSRPAADLRDNTTPHLVSDLEALRRHLGIERWQVFGGSWGSTLALAYATTFPERVTELVLRGIFLLRRWELLWFYQEGASRLYPDAFAPYRDHIPVGERGDLMSAYYRRLTDPNANVRLAAARAWSVWEGSTSFLRPDESFISGHEEEAFALAFARIEAHYFVHGGFFPTDDHLLVQARRLSGLPGVIVHGRYDVVCPVQSAFDLAAAWPTARLVVAPLSGHSAFEPEITRALVQATDGFRDR